MPVYDVVLQQHRVVLGAPVFDRLPHGVGVITDIWYDANGAQRLDVTLLNGRTVQGFKKSFSDYDRYLENEERARDSRLSIRGRLPTSLPINRP